MSDQCWFAVNIRPHLPCARWQDTGVPCGHAVTAIHAVSKAVNFMAACMSREDRIAAHAAPMQPISLGRVEELLHAEGETKVEVAALLLANEAD